MAMQRQLLPKLAEIDWLDQKTRQGTEVQAFPLLISRWDVLYVYIFHTGLGLNYLYLVFLSMVLQCRLQDFWKKYQVAHWPWNCSQNFFFMLLRKFLYSFRKPKIFSREPSRDWLRISPDGNKENSRKDEKMFENELRGQSYFIVFFDIMRYYLEGLHILN